MFFGETIGNGFPVFPNALDQITGDANIDSAVLLACHYVYEAAHVLICSVLDPRVKPEDDGRGSGNVIA